jgi:hypothetical protein
MIGLESLPVDSLTTVGLVLLEALGLYVGYGALTAVLGPHVTGAIEA